MHAQKTCLMCCLMISCDAPLHLAQVLICDTFKKPLLPTVRGKCQAWLACLWKKVCKAVKKNVFRRHRPSLQVPNTNFSVKDKQRLWRHRFQLSKMLQYDAVSFMIQLVRPFIFDLKSIVDSIYCKVLLRISIFQSYSKQKTKFGFDPGLLLMPWHRCIIGLTCEFRKVEALMASALDDRWLPFGPVDQERVAQLYQSGHKCVKLFLGHNYSEEFEVHHHVEHGMVLCDVEERLFSLDYMPLYMLCRWSGPKSVVAVQREQVNEDECLVQLTN